MGQNGVPPKESWMITFLVRLVGGPEILTQITPKMIKCEDDTNDNPKHHLVVPPDRKDL